MKKYIISASTVLIVAIVAFWLWHISLQQDQKTLNNFSDVSRLYPTQIKEVRSEKKVEDLIDIVADARIKSIPISIAGSQHSQGGHTYFEDGIVLDMRDFDAILDLDTTKGEITVESGATWRDIQNYIAPHGLAVSVMQSSYVFTVGGTLSANAHGRDLHTTTVIETVQSFRLLQADGSILNVSRAENSELFSLVIGGYGLFGVILDVTLSLHADEIYQKTTVDVNYAEFPEYFKTTIQADPSATMMLIRPSVDINADDFLKNLMVSTWHTTDFDDPSLYALTDEKNVLRDKFVFDLSRRFDWAKSLRWKLQRSIVEKGGTAYVSRNNAMRPPVAPLDFLDYRPSGRTDVIQEYYIPIKNFVPFMDSFRDIIQEDDVNILSSTIRYVKANDESAWSHTPVEDAFAIIVMSNISLSKESVYETQNTTRKILNVAIKNGGTHYLTYQLFPTIDQLELVYPKTQEVFAKKKEYDPSELFINTFYEHYARGINQIDKIYDN